jgi:glyoxylase-like metal-dependent hydrolase (beta-lactamase superfamily II)
VTPTSTAPPETLERLERALAGAGVGVEGLELIFVTHQHVDHSGLAGELARRSGAEIACLASLAPYLESLSESRLADEEVAGRLMRRHGVPPASLSRAAARGAQVAAWGTPADAVTPLAPGAGLVIGAHTWEVLHRPGHSPTDTVLYDAGRRVMIGGDHLLRDVASNAMLTPVPGPWDGVRPRPLLDYRASLELTSGHDIDLILPGHGDPITAHRDLIGERLARQHRRADKLLSRLGKRPRSAHQLAADVWGPVAVERPVLTLSEVIGHLDLLIESGLVAEREDGESAVFEALS